MTNLFLRLLILCMPVAAIAQDSSEPPLGLGQVADNLMQPVSIFSDFIDTGCFVIGGSFLFASIIKYIEHRRSPLMVPISTVVFLLIAGIVLILLPFLSLVTGSGIPYSLMQP